MKNRQMLGKSLRDFVKSTKQDRASLYTVSCAGASFLVYSGNLLTHCYNVKASRTLSLASLRNDVVYIISDISRAVGSIYKL